MEVEKITRLYQEDRNSNGACIEISPNPDGQEFGIVVRTDHTQESIDWFGKNNIVFSTSEFGVFAKACVEFYEEFEKHNA